MQLDVCKSVAFYERSVMHFGLSNIHCQPAAAVVVVVVVIRTAPGLYYQVLVVPIERRSSGGFSSYQEKVLANG